MKPQAVVFDMDGVLFDTEVVFDDAWRKAASALQIADIEPAIRDCRGVTRAFIREYFGREYSDVDFDEFDRLADRYFHEVMDVGIPMMPGILELLRDLRAAGIPTAVATSGVRGRALHHLRQTGIEDMFDAIITGDMVKNSKPAPDIYLIAAEALGVDPTQCFGVEDSHNGIRSAHAAGMHAMMVIDQMPESEEMRRLCHSILYRPPVLSDFEI